MSEPKLVVDDIHEIPWFDEVVRQSEAYLESLPIESQPTWYREHKVPGRECLDCGRTDGGCDRVVIIDPARR